MWKRLKPAVGSDQILVYKWVTSVFGFLFALLTGFSLINVVKLFIKQKYNRVDGSFLDPPGVQIFISSSYRAERRVHPGWIYTAGLDAQLRFAAYIQCLLAACLYQHVKVTHIWDLHLQLRKRCLPAANPKKGEKLAPDNGSKTLLATDQAAAGWYWSTRTRTKSELKPELSEAFLGVNRHTVVWSAEWDT